MVFDKDDLRNNRSRDSPPRSGRRSRSRSRSPRRKEYKTLGEPRQDRRDRGGPGEGPVRDDYYRGQR
jgi:hypothetical protein